MRFGVYRGARPGIMQAMGALTQGGGDAYGGTMRDLAQIDSARASARNAESEAALNEQRLGARSGLMNALEGVPLPGGLTPQAAAALANASENFGFRDFTQGMGDLQSNQAQRLAMQAAAAGDNTALNQFSTAAKPGNTYEPFAMSDAGVIDQGSGEYQVSGLARAKEAQQRADAQSKMAQAGLYGAQANAARYSEVSPWASLFDLSQGGSGGPSGIAGMMPGAPGMPQTMSPQASGIVGALPGQQSAGAPAALLSALPGVDDQQAGPMPAQGVQPGAGAPGAGILAALPPGPEPIPNAMPGTMPEPIGTAQPMMPADLQPLAGGPRLVATAPGNPAAEKLVEVYDPQSPTGTSFVRQADAIGRAGKPASGGVTMSYDAEGRPIFQMGGRQDLTTSAKNAIDQKLLDSGDTMSQITAIKAKFKPEYQQIGTRWNALRSSVMSKAGFQLPAEDRRFLREFGSYRAEAGQMFSNILKSLSGAAVTPAEMKRAEAWLPNPGTGLWDGDDPETLAEKVQRMEDFTARGLAKYSYIRRNGLDINAVDVDQMPQLMRQRGQQIESELRQQGMTPEQAQQAAVQQIGAEFGIGGY
jgi:hypothetical protein